MRPIRLIGSLAVVITLTTVSAIRIGPLPPLGAFLDPSHGVWTIATGATLPRHAEVVVQGLSDSVLVVYDDRAVPHIFASSTEDAAAALGYAVARDRLFELDAQTRATEGTLTELVGRQALEFDRSRRRLGLAESARRQNGELDSTSVSARLLEAYAAGVNAVIDGLGPRDLPFEYHLLAVRPRRWNRLYSLYMVREMGNTLSYSTLERWRAAVAERVGWDAARALFPAHAPIVEPIVPAPGETYARFDTSPLPPPEIRGGRGREVAASGRTDEFPPLTAFNRPFPPGAAERGAVGSNNWTVSSTRSASGHALLAGDPHLDLSLPSIWYEAHLVVPGEEDVYGVVLPGAPGIVIGFNRNVAWSFTNAGDDLVDYYREQLDDTLAPTAYRVDGEWRSLTRHVEQYRDRSGRVLRTDTLYSTHRGPLLEWDDGVDVSMAWTVFAGGHPFDAFLGAAQARSIGEWLAGMERFGAVTQNGAVADRHGDIAILSTGAYPRRPAGVWGDTLLDGTTSEGDWVGELAPSAYPRSVNPQQGYLASANQEPVDPRQDPRYLGADWPSPWRAMRINALLRGDSAVTLDDMQAFQTDPGSERAELFVPALLGAGGAASDSGQRAADSAIALLSQWDRRYTKDNTRAVLFELTMSELRTRAWDELAGLTLPGDAQLWRLMTDPDSPWWDILETEDVTERRDDVVRASLAAALQAALERYGDPGGGGWRWERIRHARINHLLGLASLSARDVPVQGGNGTLNPSSGSGSHGASWRMVVELGDTMAARTVYPGGQSGNPASSRYDDRVEAWSAGRLEPVFFPATPAALPEDHVLSVLVLRPGGGS